MRFAVLAAAGLVASLPALAQPASVAVTGAWARATVASAETAAIYLTVTASQPDRLTGASTPAALKTELHETRTVDGVVQMRAVPAGLPVTPGTPIHMAPGGYHVMLVGLKQQLRQGEHIPVTLTFEHAGPVTTDALVAGPGASAPPAQ